MKYEFLKAENGEFKTAKISTSDEKVVDATPSFVWAIGMHISLVLDWANCRGFKWKIKE